MEMGHGGPVVAGERWVVLLSRLFVIICLTKTVGANISCLKSEGKYINAETQKEACGGRRGDVPHGVCLKEYAARGDTGQPRKRA